MNMYICWKINTKREEKIITYKRKELTKINYLAFLAFLVTITYHTLP